MCAGRDRMEKLIQRKGSGQAAIYPCNDPARKTFAVMTRRFSRKAWAVAAFF